MPVFEYRCGTCGAKVSLLMGMVAEPDEEVCPKCGGRDLSRLVSRFRKGRDEDARIEAIADELEARGEPESPSEMREMVREMGKAMDEDLGDEMEEMFEADMEEEGAVE
ncbi:MAG: zinc ribbon domain-containing protein [Armatimonadetes bacterium]|nr:zinc ribbon domain-containing protein [Armatimonadota bacterium]